MRRVFCNGNDKAYQRKLNALLREVFFDFSFWYDLNLWDDRYESYAWEEDGRIVANLCAFRMKMRFHGHDCDALSIGAVATHPAYRGRGLARSLFEEVFARHPHTPVYLSANESVLDFYPKLGFRRVCEQLPVAEVALENAEDLENPENPKNPCRVRHDDPRVRELVFARRHFADALDCLNAETIAMFHLYLPPLRDQLYLLPALNTLVAASREGETLRLHGVFSGGPVSFAALAAQLPFSGISRIEFGFMPPWPDCVYRMEEFAGELWFVRGLACDLGAVRFPEMAVT